jgi:FMN hydrolase / 5-amino-6-(5-phospho-D-ribitylamino)uracil phosphatase
MSIECITFDLDDTLWDCESVLQEAEAGFYAWLGGHYPRITARLDPQALVVHRRRHFARYPDLAHDLTTLRKRWLAFLAEEFAYLPEREALVEQGFRVFWEGRNAVRVYDGVPDLLAGLRRRYALGVITNGNADVHYIGIGHLFDFVVTAAGAGMSKPAPGIFHAALEQAGVPAQRSMHVGDDATRDVVGASRVGMRTVWVNPRLSPWPGGRTPDAVVRSVAELEGVLEAWHPRPCPREQSG